MSNFPRLNKNRQGQADTNPPGPEAALAAIRHIAATQAIASDGNKESVKDAPTPRSNDGKTNVKPAAKGEDKSNPMTPEQTPPYSKESLAGDGWHQANQKARQLHAKAR